MTQASSITRLWVKGLLERDVLEHMLQADDIEAARQVVDILIDDVGGIELDRSAAFRPRKIVEAMKPRVYDAAADVEPFRVSRLAQLMLERPGGWGRALALDMPSHRGGARVL